jgi:hypothetical protein
LGIIPQKVFGKPVKRLEELPLGAYPLYISGQLEAEVLDIGGVRCVALSASLSVDLATMRKAAGLVASREHCPAVVCAPKLTAYQRERLSEENVAFITSGGTLYLPFLGAVLSSTSSSGAVPGKQLSSLAQCLFIGYLNGRYHGMTFSQIAKATGKSLPHISRRVKEIAAIDPQLVVRLGHEKVLQPVIASRRELFEIFKPYLMSPVSKRFFLALESAAIENAGDRLWLAGMSALSESSMLNDDKATTYATEDKDVPLSLGQTLDPIDQAEANVVIECWRYPPQLSGSTEGDVGCVDPISLYLSLEQESARDERVHKEAESLLGRILDERT